MSVQERQNVGPQTSATRARGEVARGGHLLACAVSTLGDHPGPTPDTPQRLAQDDRAIPPGLAIITSRGYQQARAAYGAVADMLLSALILVRDEGTQVFLGFSVVLRSKLSVGERKWIAWSALVSLDADDAQDVLERVLNSEENAGPPRPPLVGIDDEADTWAGWASPRELWAYGFACLARLSPKKRTALWRRLERTTQHDG